MLIVFKIYVYELLAYLTGFSSPSASWPQRSPNFSRDSGRGIVGPMGAHLPVKWVLVHQPMLSMNGMLALTQTLGNLLDSHRLGTTGYRHQISGKWIKSEKVLFFAGFHLRRAEPIPGDDLRKLKCSINTFPCSLTNCVKSVFHRSQGIKAGKAEDSSPCRFQTPSKSVAAGES